MPIYQILIKIIGDSIEFQQTGHKKQVNTQNQMSKLISLNPQQLLSSPSFLIPIQLTIGRSTSNLICIKDKRLSSHHCKLIKSQNQFHLIDQSSNGTFLNYYKMSKGQVRRINHGDQVWLLFPKGHNSIDDKGYGFRLQVEAINNNANIDMMNNQIKLNTKNHKQYITQQIAKRPTNHKQKTPPSQPTAPILSSLRAKLTCPYCNLILIYPVYLHSCSHRICGSCLSQLIQLSTQQIDKCYTCRKKYISVHKDHVLDGVIQQFLINHQDGRTEEQRFKARINNLFQHQTVPIQDLMNGSIYQMAQKRLGKIIRHQTKYKNQTKFPTNLIMQQKNHQQSQSNKNSTKQPFSTHIFQHNKPSSSSKQKQIFNNRQKSHKIIQQKVYQRYPPQSQYKSSLKQQTTKIKQQKHQNKQIWCLEQQTNDHFIKNKNKKSSYLSVQSDLSAESDSQARDKCRQCIQQRNGFKCSSNEKHISCQGCSKLIAIRRQPALSLLQHCCVCLATSCNLYYPPCCSQLLQPIGLISCPLTLQVMRNNKYQLQCLLSYLSKNSLTPKSILTQFLTKLKLQPFVYVKNKSIMNTKQDRQVRIREGSVVCIRCQGQLWFQILFRFRLAIAHVMSEYVRQRQDCYWGVNCMTMRHNYQHAKKYNHFVLQTKFN